MTGRTMGDRYTHIMSQYKGHRNRVTHIKFIVYQRVTMLWKKVKVRSYNQDSCSTKFSFAQRQIRNEGEQE